jgi:hypothetical protein
MEQLLYQQIFSVSLVWFLFIIHFPTQSFQDYPLHKDCLMFEQSLPTTYNVWQQDMVIVIGG